MGFLKPIRLTLLVPGMILLFSQTLKAQEGFRIYLIGDAGGQKKPSETMLSLKKELDTHPNSAVIYLGDNSYKNLLWDFLPYGYKGFDSSRNTIQKVMSQISILDNYHGSVFFIPGNHDWWNRVDFQDGRKKLAMEESFIRQNLSKNPNIANPENTFLPGKGGFGPDYVELDKKKIRVIFIDTYRIIQSGIKKRKIQNAEITHFYKQLDSVINAGYIQKQKILVVSHHPVYSAGPYNKKLARPYFFRRIKASMTKFPSYEEMSDSINTILKKYPGITFASGHIHALQYFYSKAQVHYIISGAGSKENKMSVKEINKYGGVESENQYLLWNSGGFFELNFSRPKTQTILYFNDGTLKCFID